jgi:hypothetical protein
MEACENITENIMLNLGNIQRLFKRGKCNLQPWRSWNRRTLWYPLMLIEFFYLVKEGNISHVEYLFIYYVHYFKHCVCVCIENDLITNKDKFGTWLCM